MIIVKVLKANDNWYIYQCFKNDKFESKGYRNHSFDYSRNPEHKFNSYREAVGFLKKDFPKSRKCKSDLDQKYLRSYEGQLFNLGI